MNYRALKEFLNGLTEEQLNQTARFWPEEAPLEEVIHAEVLDEDMIYDPEYPEEGCCRRSEVDPDDRYEIAAYKGEVILM